MQKKIASGVMATIRFCIVIIGPRVQRRKLRWWKTYWRLAGIFPRDDDDDVVMHGSLAHSILSLSLSLSIYLSIMNKYLFVEEDKNHFWADQVQSKRISQL